MLTLNDFEKKWVDYTCKLYTPFKYMSGGKNLVDTGEFEYPNLLTNSSFEATNLVTGGTFESANLLTGSSFEATNLATWSATAANNTNWTGSDCTVADEVGTVKNTVHSVKLTGTDTAPYAYQNIGASGAYASTTVTAGAWCYSDAGNSANAYLKLNDVDGNDNDGVGHKAASWAWLDVSRTTDASPGQLSIWLDPGGDTDIAYFDSVILVEGSSLIPTGWSQLRADCAYDYFSKLGTYSVRTENTGTYAALSQSGISASPSTDYTLGVWVYLPAANAIDGSGIRLADNDSVVEFTANLEAAVGADTWGFVKVTLTTGSSATTIGAFLYPYHNGGADTGEVAYFDSPVLVLGDNPVPDWPLTGAGAGAWCSSDQAKIGTYSALVQRNGADCWIYQSYGAFAVSTAYTMGSWCYATVAARARLTAGDGVGETHATHHSGTPGWEWLSLTHTTDGSASELKFYQGVVDGDTTAYFDGSIMVLGSSLTPTGWTESNCTSHYDYNSKIGTYSVRVDEDGTYSNLRQTISGTAYRNSDVTLGCWYWLDSGNTATARIGIHDGDNNWSDSLTKDDAWHFGTKTVEVDSACTNLIVILEPNYSGSAGNGEIGYFDSPTLVEGSSLTPGWTDVNCDSAPTGDEYKVGSYSMRVIGTAAGPYSHQAIGADGAYAGKTVTLGAWVNGDTGNSANALISLKDDDSTVSSTGTKAGTWAWETKSKTLGAAPGVLYAYCDPGGDGDIGYFDEIHLYEEAGIADGTTGVPINIMGASFTPEGCVFDGVDDYLWITNEDMKAAGLDFTTENMTIVVYGEFNAGTASQVLVGTPLFHTKGYYLFLDGSEALFFRSLGSSDPYTNSANGQITGTEKAVFGVTRNSVSSVSLYKNGVGDIAATSGTHIELTSSDQPFVIGIQADNFTNPLNGTLKALIILARPLGAVEMSDISRDMVEVFG